MLATSGIHHMITQTPDVDESARARYFVLDDAYPDPYERQCTTFRGVRNLHCLLDLKDRVHNASSASEGD